MFLSERSLNTENVLSLSVGQLWNSLQTFNSLFVDAKRKQLFVIKLNYLNNITTKIHLNINGNDEITTPTAMTSKITKLWTVKTFHQLDPEIARLEDAQKWTSVPHSGEVLTRSRCHFIRLTSGPVWTSGVCIGIQKGRTGTVCTRHGTQIWPELNKDKLLEICRICSATKFRYTRAFLKLDFKHEFDPKIDPYCC